MSIVPIVHLYEQIWQSVKNTQICDNFHNKAGRQLQFTPEVTLIGTHIVSKLQPNPTIIAQVINTFVHGNSFQDHFLSRPLCAKLYIWYFFQDHYI